MYVKNKLRRSFRESVLKSQKKELMEFVSMVEEVTEQMESHPILMNYYIGIVMQLKSINAAVKADVEKLD